MKYYFITYEWSKYGENPNTANRLTNIHPIDWLAGRIDDKSNKADIKILFFAEINKEIYEEHNDRW